MTSETLVSQPLDFGKFFGLAGPLFFANHSHGSWNPLVLVAYHSNTFISTWFGDPLPIIPIPSKSRQALPSARPASGRCLRRSATRRAVALPRLGEALATPSPEDGDGGMGWTVGAPFSSPCWWAKMKTAWKPGCLYSWIMLDLFGLGSWKLAKNRGWNYRSGGKEPTSVGPEANPTMFWYYVSKEIN